MSTGQLPYTISEGRPPLRNTSSEAGAPPSEVRIENDSDRKSSKSKFFKVILQTTFVHVSCYPDHYEPKIFFSVFKVHTYPSIHDFGLEGSPCNAISEGRPPLRNTSSEAGAPPSEVRIENDSDRKSSKSKFFKVFLETTFVHVSCYPDHYEPKIFFSVFKGHTYASIHDFGLEGSPCNAISEGRPSLRNTSSEAPEARKLRLQRYVSRMYLQSELTEGCKFD